MFLWHVHHPLLFNLDMHLFAYSTLFIWGCDMLIGHHSLVNQFYLAVNTFSACNLTFELRLWVHRLRFYPSIIFVELLESKPCKFSLRLYLGLQPCNVLSCIQIDVHFYQTNEIRHFIYLSMVFLIFQ